MATAVVPVYVVPPDQEALFYSLDFEVNGDAAGEDCLRSATWLIRGNPDLPDTNAEGNHVAVNKSYVFHPKFWGLALFRTRSQMHYWITHAAGVYIPVGGERLKAQDTFRWPSGARIQCGLLGTGNGDGVRERLGCIYQRIMVFSPDHTTPSEQDVIRTLCRSREKELRPQILYAHGR